MLLFAFEGEYTFTCAEKKELVLRFSSAFTIAHSKPSKHVVDGAQQASKFLEQVQVLDLHKFVDVDHDLHSVLSIRGFKEVSKDEWEMYVNHLGVLADKQSEDGNFDLTLLWKPKVSTLPEYYKIASCYTTATIGSYDLEW